MSGLEDKFRGVLSHCRAVGDLVEIYTNEDDLDRFNVGFVEAVGHDSVCLVAIDTDGEFDGRVVTRIDEIVRIHMGGHYLQALKLLHESRGQIFSHEPMPASDDDLINVPATLRFARSSRTIVTLYDYDKGATTGYIADLGEEWVQVEPILRDGRSDGFTIFRTEDIVRVDIGGKREQARGFVHQSHLGR